MPSGTVFFCSFTPALVVQVRFKVVNEQVRVDPEPEAFLTSYRPHVIPKSWCFLNSYGRIYVTGFEQGGWRRITFTIVSQRIQLPIWMHFLLENTIADR